MQVNCTMHIEGRTLQYKKILLVHTKSEIIFVALLNCDFSNIAIAIYVFYCSPCSYHSSNVTITKMSLLTSLLHFVYRVCTLVFSFFSLLLPVQLSLFQLSQQLQLSLLSLLKSIAKTKGILMALAFESIKRSTTIAIAIFRRAVTLESAMKKIICLGQSLMTQSRNQHALELEAQPPHTTFMLHNMDFT